MECKSILKICALILVVCMLCGCAEQRQNTEEKDISGDFNHKKVAVIEGTIQVDIVKQTYPEADIRLYNSEADLVSALEAGMVDAFSGEELTVREILKTRPGMERIKEPVGNSPIAIAFAKTEKGKVLRDRMNEFLEKIRENGTMDELQEKWLSGNGDVTSLPPVDYSDLSGNKEVLHFATSGMTPLFTFYKNDRVTGFDIELAVRFCREYGYGLEIETMQFSSIVPGLKSGKYDFAGNCIYVTEERKESLYFSDSYRNLDIVLVVNKKDAKVGARAFIGSVRDSFEKTFIREARWKMIIQGILTTIFISVFAAFFGTLFGFILCLIRIRKWPVIYGITTVYIRIMQGMPIVVLLMVLYYIIFAGTGLSGEWVSVFAFSLNFAAFVCALLQSGIESVDRGQTEAGLALGYTEIGAFFRIVMPQVLRTVLPVYKGEFISLVKMTSVVGYIAVQDLTKVSDIIRSRTYEAFFPLLATAVIYMIISFTLTGLLSAAEVKLKPKRKIKGLPKERISL